ncbi:EscJ/YscJ/HrcJ family type III secretion inner membrane ring protein [Serratia marcescens]|uniref:EscJ/YscJ/HrcJ family type III secretion inner membrane ring protein n=1 Tax=Serratia marcescens TaxID=615 RepID=UPI00148C9F57|nr:EscJ/YscJ/HrcJ family type III secretion inner membrane ring protein [Serratia marcescens]QJU42307.1 EscJ/YscJ/HrcJ family type III secretion inner membrane ring protein [Serratia marcescens]
MPILKALLPLLLLILFGCKEQELLKGLDQTQSNEIISLLQRNNILAVKREVAKEGFMVSVAPEDFATAVDLMHTYDLPSRPRVQIAEMFPSDSLVSSPRAEKARLYSGIEQRLEQSLHTLQGVVSSRVHVSYDLSAVEGGRDKSPVHISALIKYNNGNSEASLMISDIKRFLKNSFDDVDYENISVVLTNMPKAQHQPQIIVPKNSGIIHWFLVSVSVLVAAFIVFITYKKRKEVKVKMQLGDETGRTTIK